MSKKHYKRLLATGNLPATAETFISPSLEYVRKYRGVTVEFSLKAGTEGSLLSIGVRNAGNVEGVYGSLPIVKEGWTATSAYFKSERKLINIGLGKGPALNIFNGSILNFNLIP